MEGTGGPQVEPEGETRDHQPHRSLGQNRRADAGGAGDGKEAPRGVLEGLLVKNDGERAERGQDHVRHGGAGHEGVHERSSERQRGEEPRPGAPVNEPSETINRLYSGATRH